MMKNHLIPAFGKKRLDLITEDMIDTWLTNFCYPHEVKVQNKDGTTTTKTVEYKRNTANNALNILSAMLGYAVQKKFIKYNPCKNVVALTVNDKKKIELFTIQEVQALFPADWQGIWKNERHYMLNKLAACTGMRIGELLGLRCEYINDTYIEVAGQYGKFGYTRPKCDKTRVVPIPAQIRAELGLLMQKVNGKGFIFTNTKGDKPISNTEINHGFIKALETLGINNQERKRRGLSLHSWRHFFNTRLVMANINGLKIREVTGHASEEMTENYTHLDSREFHEVMQVQQNLLTENAGTGNASSKLESDMRNVTPKKDGEDVMLTAGKVA